MRILVTICARGGSKGLPGKNIKPILGKPLIAYSIKAAFDFKAKFSDEVVIALSTDSIEIKNICLQHGLYSDYLRPAKFATDFISKTPALRDILLYEENKAGQKFDYLIDLDVTSPFRTTDDLKSAIDIIQKDQEAINLVTVNSAHRNPYFNMLEQKQDGYYAVSKKAKNPFFSRQEAPEVYDMNSSFYIFKRRYFDDNYVGSLTDKTTIYEMPHICLDVDHPDDFDYVEYLIKSGKWVF